MSEIIGLDKGTPEGDPSLKVQTIHVPDPFSDFPYTAPNTEELLQMHDTAAIGRAVRSSMEDVLAVSKSTVANRLGLTSLRSVIAVEISPEDIESFERYFFPRQPEPVEAKTFVKVMRYQLLQKGARNNPIAFRAQSSVLVRDPESTGLFKRNDRTDADGPTKVWGLIDENGNLRGEEYAILATSQRLDRVTKLNDRMPRLVRAASLAEARKKSGGITTQLWHA